MIWTLLASQTSVLRVRAILGGLDWVDLALAFVASAAKLISVSTPLWFRTQISPTRFTIMAPLPRIGQSTDFC